jgi:hypothetical protein
MVLFHHKPGVLHARVHRACKCKPLAVAELFLYSSVVYVTVYCLHKQTKQAAKLAPCTYFQNRMAEDNDDSATGSLSESINSVATSAVAHGTKFAGDCSVAVCERNLLRMAAERSIVNTRDIRLTGNVSLTMSPLIEGLLKATSLTTASSEDPGQGLVWVVCAPHDQGKTFAAEFLMHGDHNMRPDRSIKIDATNMEDFPKDCARRLLNCPASADTLSTLLCNALASSAGADQVGLAAKTADLAGKVVCDSELTIPFESVIKMNDAEQHDILKLGKRMQPRPVLIIDEFYCNTEANIKFVRTLFRDASQAKVVVFLMTNNQEWATKLIGLNGCAKIKPLPTNLNNAGYTGAGKFTGEPEWNNLAWSVAQLRTLVGPFCTYWDLDPAKVVSDDAKCSPAEAFAFAREQRAYQELEALKRNKNVT